MYHWCVFFLDLDENYDFYVHTEFVTPVVLSWCSLCYLDI